MLRDLFYPGEVKVYTDNVGASVSNCMSGWEFIPGGLLAGYVLTGASGGVKEPRWNVGRPAWGLAIARMEKIHKSETKKNAGISA